MSLSAATKSNSKGFLDTVTCHSFNENRTQVAVGTPTEIYIYDCSASTDPTKWVKLHTLSEHTGVISGIDWNHITDQIVSCGHDRNAYVWNFESLENRWRPTICILRINRAATSVKWAPSGLKFALTSSAKTVCVCSYDENSNWWLCRSIKKFKSTVSDCAFSPSSHLLVTASTDGSCRIHSIFADGLDSKDSQYDGIFDDDQYSFGALLAEYNVGSWVNSVAWSPNGKTVAFGTQGSVIYFANLDEKAFKVENLAKVYHRDLPILSSYFMDDNTLIAVGFDKNPIVFSNASGTWEFSKYAEKENTAAVSTNTASATSRAFAMFQQADSQGTKFGTGAAKPKVADFTTHKNTITCINPVGSDTTKFTTSGLDGRIVHWDTKTFM